MFPQKILRFFFLLRRTWDFEYDFTVTSTSYTKQSKIMASTTDVSPKEELQGATCKWWSPFALLLIVAKQNLPLDSQLLEVSKGHGGLVLPYFGQVAKVLDKEG